MRTRHLGPLVMVLATLLTTGAAASNWTRFDSQAGRFSVMVPSPPQHRTSTNESPVGAVVENTYVAEMEGACFAVSYTDLPAVALLFEGADGIYGRAKDALLEQVGGEAVAWRAATVSGRPGRALDYRTAGGRAGRALLVLAGRRLYVADASNAGQGDLSRFHASLQIR